MLFHNVTSVVEHRIHDDWLRWMERAYLPAVLESGPVAGYYLTRLRGVDETEGPTYALLLRFDSKMVFDIYQEKFYADHQRVMKEKWGKGVFSFPSTLDVVARG